MSDPLTESDAMEQLDKSRIRAKRIELHGVGGIERKCAPPERLIQQTDALVAISQPCIKASEVIQVRGRKLRKDLSSLGNIAGKRACVSKPREIVRILSAGA
jgi:hypothetical protein